MFTRYAKSASAVLCAAALAIPAMAHADAAKNLQVAGRALTFLEGGPSGATRMGVVFDPSKPASVAEKNAVMAAIGSGYNAGAIKLMGTAVEAGALGGSNAQVFFVTSGVNYAAVGAAARSKKIITISSDAACANSGACVMAVATQPKVEIIVNRATASAVGAAFKAAFRMMIKEV